MRSRGSILVADDEEKIVQGGRHLDRRQRGRTAAGGHAAFDVAARERRVGGETVRRALGSTHGVKKFAADLLGISQRALSYYLSKHQIE